MPVPSLNNARWKITDLEVTFETKYKDATAYKTRVLNATVERDADAWSVIQYGTVFTNAADTVEDLLAYVADAGGPGVTPVEHSFTFYGEWQVGGIRTRIQGGRATLVMSLWQYTGQWESVDPVTP